jgi:hypothetical protein
LKEPSLLMRSPYFPVVPVRDLQLYTIQICHVFFQQCFNLLPYAFGAVLFNNYDSVITAVSITVFGGYSTVKIIANSC